MDYYHKMWTVVVLLRDDSFGHPSSNNAVTTWSRLSEIFSYISWRMGFDYQIWTVDMPHEEATIRFSSAGVWEVIAARSSDFHKCLCIQFFDHRNQITVATIGEEPLNYIRTFVIDPPLIIFFYLLKLVLATSYPGKLSQSDKHFVRLPLLKEVYGSYENFFDIYLSELNNLETL